MKKKLYQPLYLAILALLLTACASTPRKNSVRSAGLSAEAYLQMAANSQGAAKQANLLKAANQFLRDRQAPRAQSVLYQLPNRSLNQTLLAKKQLLQANIYLIQNRITPALNLLTKLQDQQSLLATSDRIALHQLLAYAYQKQGNVLASLQQRSQITQLASTKEQREQAIQKTWQSLQNNNPQALTNALEKTDDKALRGWLSLAIITEKTNDSTKHLAQQLAYWKQQYPQHPATNLLPSNLQYAKLIAAEPKHIALLLPLQGSLSSVGTAVRNGFLAAYYSAKKRNATSPKITVIDTTNKNISDVYQKAVADGADFVVGPLTKTALADLVKSTKLTVPTLALNTLADEQRSIHNLYQFGLSPIDEARQAANRAFADHHGRAIVIAPANNWGRSIANQFIQQWQSLGGQVVDQMYYTKQQTLAKEMQAVLRIDKAESNAKNLKRILREKIRYIPRRRKDVDSVFLVAQPVYARQIRPLLRFYYAGRVPVYTISQVYNGIPSPHRDHDLNGIIFCDMPWVLQAQQMQPTYLDNIQQHIKSLWPNSYRQHPKLYALGVDAFNAVANLNKMAMLPQFGTRGATGTLYLNAKNHVYRKLLWAQMIHGTPNLIQ